MINFFVYFHGKKLTDAGLCLLYFHVASSLLHCTYNENKNIYIAQSVSSIHNCDWSANLASRVPIG